MEAKKLIEQYYQAFNNGDITGFLNLLDDNIIHDINQGNREVGKAAFKKFMEHMNTCYREHISDLVIFTHSDNTRVAAEFSVEGTYLKTDDGFPQAKNQTYKLPAGAFFEIKNNKICRVTNYYNVNEWIKLISNVG